MEVGPKFAIRAVFETCAKEAYAGIGFGRMQGERYRQAGMNSDTAQRRLITKCRLPTDFHTVPPTRSPMSRHATHDF